MVNGSAGLQQVFCYFPNVLNRDAFDRKGKETRASAGNQGEQQTAFFQMIELVHHLLRGFQIRFVRNRVRRFEHLDLMCLFGMAVARNDNAG